MFGLVRGTENPNGYLHGLRLISFYCNLAVADLPKYLRVYDSPSACEVTLKNIG